MSREPVENVKHAINWLDETNLNEEELVRDPEFNTLLDPIRYLPDADAIADIGN